MLEDWEFFPHATTVLARNRFSLTNWLQI